MSANPDENEKWIQNNHLTIQRHSLARNLYIVAVVFLAVSLLGIFLLIKNLGNEYFVASIAKTCHSESIVSTSKTENSSKEDSQTTPTQSPTSNIVTVSQFNNSTQAHSSEQSLDPEHTKEIIKISYTPKIWVLFLLLSAAVGSLWAILWAVVSLCRTD